MKSIIIICSILSFSLVSTAQTKSVTIKVAGNCEMCQNNIEQSALGAGATSASWNADLQQLSITIDEKANSIDVEKAIAAAGYDTENIQGDSTAYSNLPHCCQYERTTDYSSAKAECCTSYSDATTCCNHEDKDATCCKHDGNNSSCCKAENKDACCKADKSCCTASTRQGEACCKEGKCMQHQ